MATSTFRNADDPRKHYLRTRLWLPFCRRQSGRLRALRHQVDRPLRYLTFCAKEAVDVLMLEKEGVISAPGGQYSHVTFAEFRDDDVTETLRTIPGATGFTGDFFETVLFDETDETGQSAAVSTDAAEKAFFEALRYAKDTPTGRARLSGVALRDQLASQFPFDVINLDLCGRTFKRSENIPGRTILALRRILDWQRRPRQERGVTQEVREFALLYTTQIDIDAELGEKNEILLANGVNSNLRKFPDLRSVLENRLGADTAAALSDKNRREYLFLATAKQVIMTAVAKGWEIDPDHQVPCFQITRHKSRRTYFMLHLAMHLRRVEATGAGRSPRVDQRKNSAYHGTVKDLFAKPVLSVPAQIPPDVQSSLAELLAKGSERRQA